jgi:histidinol dehydrogenase
VADETADPFTVATNILSQAEHGPDSPTIIISTSESVARRAMEIMDEMLDPKAKSYLPTAELAGTSYRTLGDVVVVDSLDEAYQVADEYAAEHVQILTKRPREALEKMTNYGAIFLGEKTCVSYGDKVSLSSSPLSNPMLNPLSVLARTMSCQRRKLPNILEVYGSASS